MALFANRQWAVTDYGLVSVRPGALYIYEIEASRLLEAGGEGGESAYDWPIHMAEKTWIDLEAFIEAYTKALELHSDRYEGAVDESMLAESIRMARKEMPIVRLARASDLPALLSLFAASEVSAAAQPFDRAERIWQETLAQQGVAVFVADDRDRIAATCTLITAPNLLRGGRCHAFLENVVTYPELRGRGFGKSVVQAALAHAWATDCYHVLMQSGRKDLRVHAFYEGLGFESGVRTAYVARRPAMPGDDAVHP